MTSSIKSFSLLECLHIVKIFLVFLTQDRITKSITKFQICDLDFAWAPGFQNIITKICTMPKQLES